MPRPGAAPLETYEPVALPNFVEERPAPIDRQVLTVSQLKPGHFYHELHKGAYYKTIMFIQLVGDRQFEFLWIGTPYKDIGSLADWGVIAYDHNVGWNPFNCIVETDLEPISVDGLPRYIEEHLKGGRKNA